MNTQTSTESKLAIAHLALSQIANTIEHFENVASEKGCEINSAMALQLSNDAGFLRGIAINALSEIGDNCD